jgi:hypothetical protein
MVLGPYHLYWMLPVMCHETVVSGRHLCLAVTCGWTMLHVPHAPSAPQRPVHRAVFLPSTALPFLDEPQLGCFSDIATTMMLARQQISAH